MVMEGWLPENKQRLALFKWIWPKFIRGLDYLERCCEGGFKQFDIGQAAMLHAVSYMDFRAKFYARPSVKSHYNLDFVGDDSAEFCQANVNAVLALQKEHGTR